MWRLSSMITNPALGRGVGAQRVLRTRRVTTVSKREGGSSESSVKEQPIGVVVAGCCMMQRIVRMVLVLRSARRVGGASTGHRK